MPDVVNNNNNNNNNDDDNAPISLIMGNMFKLFSAISPMLLVFFLVVSSLFNQDVKGLIYLAGLMLACIINIFAMNQIKSIKSPGTNVICELFDFPKTVYNSPNITSMMISFTTLYVLLPMNYNNAINYSVVVFFLCMFSVDTFTKIKYSCTTGSGIVLGTLVGGLLGLLWYSLLKNSGNSSLLYFDELQTNKVKCSKPDKQTFKCSVYKNGTLISNNIV
jgi:hypothetical protein